MFARLHLPPLGGATAWLNSEPLSPAGLRGRVVLVNFWTFTCINWLRQEPWVRAWSRAYQDDGLVVLGVHTPEFSFEHDVDAVRRATVERDIDYPVAVDNAYVLWSAFANHHWPALYFVDREGHVRDSHFGEGRYDESERLLQELLGVRREPLSVAGIGVEAEADWRHLRTAETYLGRVRGEGFASPGGAVAGRSRRYAIPGRLRLGQWALAGGWTREQENVVLHEAGGSIACRFFARDVHLVLSCRSGEPIPFRVRLDGWSPGVAHGVDVDGEGNGVLGEGRMYQLVRQHDGVRERTLEITFHAPGAEAYSFTFG